MKTIHVILAVAIGAVTALTTPGCGGNLRDDRIGVQAENDSTQATDAADAGTTDTTDAGPADASTSDTTPATVCGEGTHHEFVGDIDTCVANDPNEPPAEVQYCLDRNGNGALDCTTCIPGTSPPGPLYKQKTETTPCEEDDAANVDTTSDAGTPTETDAGTEAAEVLCGEETILVGNTCELAPATDGGTTPDASTTEEPDAGSAEEPDAGPSTTTCGEGTTLVDGECVADTVPTVPSTPPSASTCTVTISVPAAYTNLRATQALDPSGQVSWWDSAPATNTLAYTVVAGVKDAYFQADAVAGNHWLCEGYTDTGDTAAHLTTSVTVTGCGFGTAVAYHKPNAVHTDGCAARISRP